MRSVAAFDIVFMRILLFPVPPAPFEAFAARKRLRVRAKISLHPEAPGVSRASKDESEHKAAA